MPKKSNKKEDKYKRKKGEDSTKQGKCPTKLKPDGSCVLVKSDLFRRKWQEERDKWLDKKKDKMTSADRRHLVKKTLTTANEANQLTDVKKQIKKVKNLLSKLMVQQSLLTPSSNKALSHLTPDVESEEEEEEEGLRDQQDSQELF